MAPRNVLLLTFWLLAAAICITYVGVRREPVAPGLLVSSREDVQISGDRPLGSWGSYLPRPVLTNNMPHPTPPLGSDQPTVEHVQEPKQPVVEERTAPYSSESSPVAQAVPPKRTQEALLGAENEQFAPARTSPKSGKPKPSGKLAHSPKISTEGFSWKSRFARRERGRGLGLFALSGDFGPTRY
jgi:hypothetical protein